MCGVVCNSEAAGSAAAVMGLASAAGAAGSTPHTARTSLRAGLRPRPAYLGGAAASSHSSSDSSSASSSLRGSGEWRVGGGGT